MAAIVLLELGPGGCEMDLRQIGPELFGNPPSLQKNIFPFRLQVLRNESQPVFENLKAFRAVEKNCTAFRGQQAGHAAPGAKRDPVGNAGGRVNNRPLHFSNAARLGQMLEEVEVFTGFPMIHSSHAGVSFRPAGHGASHRVKGIGGAGPFETEHIGSQK